MSQKPAEIHVWIHSTEPHQVPVVRVLPANAAASGSASTSSAEKPTPAPIIDLTGDDEPAAEAINDHDESASDKPAADYEDYLYSKLRRIVTNIFNPEKKRTRNSFTYTSANRPKWLPKGIAFHSPSARGGRGYTKAMLIRIIKCHESYVAEQRRRQSEEAALDIN